VRLTATYGSADELLSDQEKQWAVGGILVRLADPPDLPRLTRVELCLSTPFGSAEVAAEVMQVLPGVGVALSFDQDDSAVQALLSRARGETPQGVEDDQEEEDRTFVRRYVPNPAIDARTRVKNATQTEKMQIAIRGNREERNLIIRDSNRSLHQFVLKNPKIQVDEVAAIAGMRTVSSEVLNFIAARHEWASRPEIALALVRNPKTPVGRAVKLVDHISPTALRQLAKVAGLRMPILRAVRKKVLR
jgi:hypothetical protein